MGKTMSNELNRELIKTCWENENFNANTVIELLEKGADINFRWDIHTYNPEDIAPENIKVTEGGILFKIPDLRMGGNVNPQTGEMYKGDRVCPLDLALGYVSDDDIGERNLVLLKILIENDVDYISAHAYTNYKDEEILLIREIQSKVWAEKLSSELSGKNQKRDCRNRKI